MLLSFLLVILLIRILVISSYMTYDISVLNKGIKTTALITSVINLLCSLLIFIHKYNPFIIIYKYIYNYKCSNILANLIIIICLLLIKKLVTGNYFIVSMSMKEAILIFIYG